MRGHGTSSHLPAKWQHLEFSDVFYGEDCTYAGRARVIILEFYGYGILFKQRLRGRGGALLDLTGIPISCSQEKPKKKGSSKKAK